MSTKGGNEEDHVVVTDQVPRVLCSQRWNLAALAFFGFMFVYVVRVNLSVAIICMVRSPPAAENNGTNQYNATTNDSTLGYGVDFTTTMMTTFQPETLGSCGGDVGGDSSPSYKGEFDWDKSTRATILSMFFYGYIFTQIPGGWLAGRYGGKRVWGVCQAISAICTILTPLAARTHVIFVYTMRFMIGLGTGVTFPCVHAMLGRWSPKLERSKIVAFAFSGPPIATILTFSLSALLCEYGFDNGWGSIFYLAGAGNLLWVVTWMLFTADTPVKHKRISRHERNYILHSIGEKPADSDTRIATPWKAMFTSGPLWAVITAHSCNNYTGYTLLTSLPTFMKEVLKFDIKQNGLLSAMPYVCQAISSMAMGTLADWLRSRGILSTKMTRKVMQCTSFLGVAVCITCAGFLTCDQRDIAIVLICLCLAFMGLNRAGYNVNHIDLAPRYAGVLFGITNTFSTIPGMIAPLVAGALTPNKTAEEWRNVFYVCTANAIFGALVFGLLADGELQSWAVPPGSDITFHVNKEDANSYTTDHEHDVTTSLKFLDERKKDAK